MIITRTPLRISIGGGGTDLPSYYSRHGGFVISAAVSRYVYIALHPTFQRNYIIKYSQMETVDRAEDIKHPILNGGAPVRGAGEVVFGRGGLVTDINNATGHYTPTCGCGADLQAGVDAFNNAGVAVLRGAIRAFGW